MNTNLLFINLLKLLHFLLIVAIVYFSVFTKPEKTWISITIIGVIYISWSLFDGDCVITKLEDKLIGERQESGFVGDTIEKVFGKKISNTDATNICNGVFGAIILISIYRFREYAIRK